MKSIKNPNIKLFLKDLKKQCKDHKIKLTLVNDHLIDYGKEGITGIAGWFDGKELACAIGGKEGSWIKTLVHESCHLDQFIEKSKFWKESNIRRGNLTENWINGKEYPQKEVRIEFNREFRLELDCEKRSVEKIIKYNLPVPIERYIQQANSYLWIYKLIPKIRQWYTGYGPSNCDELTAKMPKHFNVNYHQMPKKIEKLYMKYCFTNEN